MGSRKGNPIADLFYKQVLNKVDIPVPKDNHEVTGENLILFIKIMIDEYSNLYNPLIMYLNKIIQKAQMMSLQQVTIKTNSNKINVRKMQT
jgi:hypothetical protein